MRIAIYHNLPSGGAKRALYDQVRFLGALHHFDLYTLATANHEFADLRPFAHQHYVYGFRPTPLLSSPWGRLNQAARLFDLLRIRRLSRQIAHDIEARGYDLVFVHGCQFEKAPSLLCHIKSVPTIYYCQESLRHLYEAMPVRPYEQRSRVRAAMDRVDPLPALYRATLRHFDRRNLQHAGKVLTNSEHTRCEVKRIYQVDAQVSYLGVDTEQFHPRPAVHENFVLSVGSLTPLKAFDFLITALATIPSSRRPPLFLASNFQDPVERAYLAALAAGCMVEVHFLGNVSDEQLVALYHRASMTLYAPIREPFGLVPLESMACGTPVVAVNEGGIAETVIQGITGLLTERDAKQFGAAMQCLLEDPALAAKLGMNGRNHVLAKWSCEEAVTRLEHHFSRLLCTPRRREQNLVA